LVSAQGPDKEESSDPCVGYITDGMLCLQLRANKNVFHNVPSDYNSDPSYLPNGSYEVCLTYKHCSGEFENLSLFRIDLTKEAATPIAAYWGRHTSKRGLVIQNGDITDLTGYYKGTNNNNRATVGVCGTVEQVYNNANDFVVCIQDVLQCFNLDDILTPAGGDLESATGLTDAVKNNPALLANSKLYVTIKYEVLVPGTSCPGFNDPVPVSSCPGSLNPFSTVSICGRQVPGHYKVKGFSMCEIVSLIDHPLQGSGLPKETTCCVTHDNITNFNNKNPN